MAKNLLDWLKSETLDKTNLDEKAVEFFKPQTGTLATAGREAWNKLAATPISQTPQPVQWAARGLENIYNTENKAITMPAQFAAGTIQGQNLNLGTSPFRAPRNPWEQAAYTSGVLAGSMNPKSITNRVIKTVAGTQAASPLNILKAGAVGSTLSPAMETGATLLTQKRLPTKEELGQSALSGVENSWTLALTNAVTDKALKTLAPKLVGPAITSPFKSGQVREGINRVMSRALAEVLPENFAFTGMDVLRGKEGEDFVTAFWNNLPGSIAQNLIMAGGQSALQIGKNKKSSDALNKEINAAAKKAFDATLGRPVRVGKDWDPENKVFRRYEDVPVWKSWTQSSSPGFIDLGAEVGTKRDIIRQDKVFRIRADAPRKVLVKTLKQAKKEGARIELTPAKPDVVVPSGLKIGAGEELLGLPSGMKQEIDTIARSEVEGMPQTGRVTQFFRNMFLDTADNLRKTTGEGFYTKRVEPLVDRLTTRIARSVDWGNAERKSLSQVVKQHGVNPGSEDDMLIRSFQEGPKGKEKVISAVGIDRANQLEEVYNQLRSSYDRYYKLINNERVNSGLKELPYHGDTFLSQIGGKRGDFFTVSKPSVTGEYSAGIFKKQEAGPTTGAIESMVSYIDKAERAGFTDSSAIEFKKLKDELANISGVPKAVVDELNKVEQAISGAGKTIGGLDGAFERYMGLIKGAKVAGKASTLVNQSLSLPHGIAEAGPVNFIKGFSKDADQAASKSNLLKAISKKTPSNLRVGGYDKYTGFLGDTLQDANNIAYKSIWKGLYSKAKQLGVPDAVKWADKEGARILGDRRMGMTPAVYNTLVGRILGAFTIEPTAMTTAFAQNIARKKFGTALGYLVAWKIGNELNQEFGTGGSMLPDPYEALKDASELWTGTDEKQQNKLQSFMRVASEALQMTPIIQNAVYSSYSLGETAGVLPDSKKVFGQEDPTWMNVGNMLNPLTGLDRRITGNKLVDVPMNIASKYVPGADQLAKTTQAAASLNRGYATTKTGTPTFTMDQDPYQVLQALVMGQGSTKASREFYDKGAAYPTEKQTQLLESMPTREEKVAALKQWEPINRAAQSVKNKIKVIQGGGKTGGGGGVVDKDLTKAKLENGIQPTEKELESYFMGDLAKMPSKTAYEKDKIEESSYSVAKKIYDNELVSDVDKQKLYKKLGVSPEEMDYTAVAGDNTADKSLFISEKVASMDDNSRLEFLLKGRTIVNGKQLISDTIANQMYKNGEISVAERDALKSIKFVKDNEYKGEDAVKMGDNTYKPVEIKGSGGTAKGFGSDKMVKAKMPTSVSSLGGGVKSTFKISIPKSKTIKFSKPNLKQKRNWRKIKLSTR